MFYETLEWQPVISYSSSTGPKDGPFLLRRKATSYKTGLGGVLGREKTAVRLFLGLASGIGDILGDNALQGHSNARQLTPSRPREVKAALQVFRRLAAGCLQEVQCVFAPEPSTLSTHSRLPCDNVSLEQMQILIKSATCDLFKTKGQGF